MDSIPSSPPNVNSPGIGNGSMDDRASGAGKLGEYSLSASLPDGNDEKKESIARLSALKAQQRPLEPPSLESRLCSIAQSRKPSNSLFYPIKAVGKKAVNLGSKIFHCLIWRSITPVRKSVVKAGGEMTSVFSQGKGKWLENMIWDRTTRSGCCWALSLDWLKHRARGTSLFDEIHDDQQNGEINPEVFEKIRALQEAGSSNQNFYTDQWLRMNGMTHFEVVGNSAIGSPWPWSQYLTSDQKILVYQDNFPQKLAETILDHGNRLSGLKLVRIRGRKYDHALAAHIDPDNGSVTFFDPNFGEFRFSSGQAFKQWFVEQFWPKSRYGGVVLRMNQNFAVKHIAYSGEDSERSI
ncbi:YopT-type cysteine protease domain-containing protein [Salinisphaera sp. G21_0]|uniref:YopT-type cysteine protease domain-containing protein n=1 Tax=Salinisphaera sp. G21_0 TaxID=2821094 RepID=UPI001ADC2CDD|nr:YopT-type cysteine protease domain-containing protein [Salinisphaera sp. G21_0]MBO9482771.1 YopT-type cysteine protease domain-containing protein [Salinisphaera sp. G21_0]